MDEAGGIGHVPDAALAIRDGRIAWVGTRQQLQAMSWSAPVVTEARGLWITPGLIECHTHRVRRRSQQRVRGAVARRDVRRHRTRRRRNRIDDARHALRAKLSCSRNRCLARGAGERRRDDAGGEIGLRARPRERAEDAARCEAARRATRHRCGQDVSRRARAAARVREPAGRLRPSRVRRHASRGRGGAARRCGRCVLRTHRLYARAD